jgi:histidine ammonia-lyase
MVAENRRLAAPASVDSLPTSAMQEDHVSMGWGAARKLRTVVANLTRILAVELVCSAHGIDLRAPLQPGPGTAAALRVLRERVAAGGTVIMTTHILEVAERMADRIGVIAAGRLVAEGTLTELRQQNGHKDTSLEDLFIALVAVEAEAA